MKPYKRILLKLSGEALAGEDKHGFDPEQLKSYTKQIKSIVDQGVQVGLVIGGGNLFRGLAGLDQGFDRVKGDYMGMLATVINGLALQSAFEKAGIATSLFTASRIEAVGERFNKLRAIKSLENGAIAIFTYGTGNPYFTTDTAAALRAVEIEADVFLKGTRVDGVYSADPEKDPSAVKYDTLSFEESLEKQLRIMDQTAFTFCRDNNLPVIVFNVNREDSLFRIISGEKIGTLIKN